ncbi:hypothetical protein, partial [Methylobacterium sp. BTF04]|uniref:hypothetical protein n=1 Tax=Methylobacterium sp. BTF04 TaxID=2708300 RepID=UPI00195303A7
MSKGSMSRLRRCANREQDTVSRAGEGACFGHFPAKRGGGAFYRLTVWVAVSRSLFIGGGERDLRVSGL